MTTLAKLLKEFDLTHRNGVSIPSAEAPIGSWHCDASGEASRPRPLPGLQWDNSQARDDALRASDPSKDKKLGVPGADWLAFRGVPFIRGAPVGDEVMTTGCRGGWKTGAFRWPVWDGALERAVVHSLLASRDLFAVEPCALRTCGVAIVFESSIGRSDQGLRQLLSGECCEARPTMMSATRVSDVLRPPTCQGRP